MQEPRTRAYRFGQFRLDLIQQRLIGPDGQALAQAGRAFDVLSYLIEHRAHVVGKDELLRAVWPHVVVEENNLNQAISILRKALGDSRDSPNFILTVAGRGYRFIADVTSEPSGAAASPPDPPEAGAVAPALPAQPSLTRRQVIAGVAVAGAIGAGAVLWLSRSPAVPSLPTTIAVLPFEPLVGSGDQALELGMAETLINRLSVLPGVVVTPFSSVRPYAGRSQNPLAAGRELAVAAVIEGHVQVREDRVRLTARLLKVADGSALWSGTFDERLSDFFAVQDTLAQQLVDALAVPVPDATRRRLVQNYTTMSRHGSFT
jgi:DNA-binding winged helix-turn-helix (wHTH) protein/TolB-like protein